MVSRQRRKEAAHRRRRIIFNNDGNEVVYLCKTATPEEVLRCRTSPLVGSHVDSIFYCTWSSGFGLFTHNTKVGEVFTCKQGMFADNITRDLIEQGTDPLQIMVDFCRRNDLEIFWSMRMNDTHDAWGGDYSPYLFPKLKREHAEYLVGSKEDRPKHGGWTAVDYAHPQVRELAFRFVEEVCCGYDVDGVELDFFRHPTFFKRAAMGLPLGQEELDMMTGLMRRIREVTEEVAEGRGRPLLVAVRVPDSVEYCRGIGIDLERWLAEDLVDILIATGYFRLNPWEYIVDLGHRYDVPVYACLSESRIPGEAGEVRNSIESYRARAMKVWNSGADGVYMFNFFDPHSPLWRELGDPEILKGLDKVYFVTVRGIGNAGFFLAGGERYFRIPILAPQRPLKLEMSRPQVIELPVGDDVLWGKDRGILPELNLRLQVGDLKDAEDISVELNGELLSGGILSGGWLDYTLKPDLVRKGVNRFKIGVKPGSGVTPVVFDLQLWIRYRESS